MTGSGKTGLGVVLIEEVLRAGLPALLIDPKGDLTNLCLTFPDLAPGRLPAVDRRGPGQGGRRRRPTSSPPSRRRRGRTAWPAGATGPSRSPRCGRRPTSRSTRPARSRACRSTSSARCRCPATDDAEVVGDEIEGYVSGLLGLVGIEADPLSSREHILLANLIQHSWSAGHVARPADARRAWSSSRRSASSACSSSTSSSRPTTARSWR